MERSNVRDLTYLFNTSQSKIAGIIQSEKAVFRGKQLFCRLEAGLSLATCNSGHSLPSLPHFPYCKREGDVVLRFYDSIVFAPLGDEHKPGQHWSDFTVRNKLQAEG